MPHVGDNHVTFMRLWIKTRPLVCPKNSMAMDQSLEIPFIGMNIHLPAILVFTMGIGMYRVLTHIHPYPYIIL